MGSSASTFKTEYIKQETMICANCSSSINIITKKKCDLCHQNFCTKCLNINFPFLKTPKVCPKCTKLQSGKFNRKDLELYSIKELRQFLSRSKIPLKNCFERSDLVILVLKTASIESNIEDTEHKKHVLNLKEKLEKELNSATHPIPSFGGTSETVGETIDYNNQPIGSRQGSNGNRMDRGEATNGENEIIPRQSTILKPDITDSKSPDDFVVRSCPNSEEHKSKTENHFKDPVKLEHITNQSEIDLLSSRQMKELLTRNFVNYKGCCERDELSGMVSNLWKEHVKNVSYENIEEPLNLDVCKICMDRVIDCVLLECGHMVACKQCGKQLAECPVCRKYVSRVVHVFRT